MQRPFPGITNRSLTFRSVSYRVRRPTGRRTDTAMTLPRTDDTVDAHTTVLAVAALVRRASAGGPGRRSLPGREGRQEHVVVERHGHAEHERHVQDADDGAGEAERPGGEPADAMLAAPLPGLGRAACSVRRSACAPGGRAHGAPAILPSAVATSTREERHHRHHVVDVRLPRGQQPRKVQHPDDAPGRCRDASRGAGRRARPGRPTPRCSPTRAGSCRSPGVRPSRSGRSTTCTRSGRRRTATSLGADANERSPLTPQPNVAMCS